MATERIPSRFQLLRTLAEREHAILHVARDVAREREVWLLMAQGASVAGGDMAIRYRLARAAKFNCFRALDVIDVIADAKGICVVLEPPQGLHSTASADDEVLRQSLTAAADAGFHAGALSFSDLHRDDRGAFFLPTSYALPPCVVGRRALPFNFAPRAARMEIDALLQDADAVAAVATDFLPLAFDTEPSGILLRGTASTSTPLLEQLQGRCDEAGRRLILVGTHWHSPTAEGRGKSEPGVVVYLGIDPYACAAESVARLRKLGWIDGRETVVVASPRPARAKSATLALSTLSHRLDENWSEIDLGGFDAPRRSLDTSLAKRVAQLLEVAERPLPAEVLRDVLRCPSEELVAVLGALEEGGWIRTLFACSDELSAAASLIVELLAFEFAEPIDPTRERELRALLDASSAPQRGRGGLGRSWLAFRSQLHARDTAAIKSAHRLAERAKRQQLPLLEFAVYETLLGPESDVELSATDRCRAAASMGEQLRVHGEVEAAEEIFERALSELDEGSGRTTAGLVAEILQRYTDLLEHQARFADIDRRLAGALDRYGGDLVPEQRGRLYLQHARALRHLGRFPESVARAELALKLFDPERFPRELSEIYTNLGLTYWARSDYASARDAYRRGLQLAEEAGDDLGAARLWNNLGLAHRAGGEFAKAEEALSRSAEIKARIDDLKGLAATQLNLGFVYLDRGDHLRGRRCAEQCLNLARKLQQGELEAQAFGLMGECAREAGDFIAAEKLFREDLRLSDTHGMRNERLATLRRMVDVVLRMGRLDDAAELLEEARASVPDSGSRLEPALLELLEARLLRNTGAAEPALDLYGSAATKLGHLKRRDLQLDALVERGTLQVALSELAGARRTLQSIRETQAMLAEPKLMEELTALELAVAETDAPDELSLTEPDAVLAAVGDLVRRAQAGEVEAVDAATKLAMEALSLSKVEWLDIEKDRSTSRDSAGLNEGGISAALRRRLSEWVVGTRHGRYEGYDLITSLRDGRFLVLWRDEALGDREIELAETLANIIGLALRQAVAEVEAPPSRPSAPTDHGIIGESSGMRDVLRQIDLVKDNDVTVLLLGENGTGKDLVARAIHRAGRRKESPFHAVNCAAIPHSLLESELFGHERGSFTGAHQRHLGLFERADRGTLFLDEIGEMDAAMQAKLLRVLQDQSFTRVGGTETIRSDVRVIAATNRDLAADVERGEFRMDLYYRLNVVSIEIPALRDRPEDIGLLAHHFIERLSSEFESPVRRMKQEAVARLMAYDWPGNVRELENVIKNAMVFAEGERIRVEDLPSHVLGGTTSSGRRGLEGAVRDVVAAEELSQERPLMPRLELLLAYEVVRATQNKTLAAKILGITKPTLYARLKRFEALYGGRTNPLDRSRRVAGSDG